MTRHLNLTGWCREALSLDEQAGFEARAASLGAYVTASGANPGGPWTVYASSASISAAAHGSKGGLAAAITAVLDDFRERKAEVAADLVEIGFPESGYSGAELMQIASQSGIEVRRD